MAAPRPLIFVAALVAVSMAEDGAVKSGEPKTKTATASSWKECHPGHSEEACRTEADLRSHTAQHAHCERLLRVFKGEQPGGKQFPWKQAISEFKDRCEPEPFDQGTLDRVLMPEPSSSEGSNMCEKLTEMFKGEKMPGAQVPYRVFLELFHNTCSPSLQTLLTPDILKGRCEKQATEDNKNEDAKFPYGQPAVHILAPAMCIHDKSVQDAAAASIFGLCKRFAEDFGEDFKCDHFKADFADALLRQPFWCGYIWDVAANGDDNMKKVRSFVDEYRKRHALFSEKKHSGQDLSQGRQKRRRTDERGL